MSKQTAVDFLYTHLLPFVLLCDDEEREFYRKCLSEAKEMHKQEIIDAFKSGLKSPYHQDYTFVTQDNQEGTKSGQYYQETFVSKGSDETPFERKLLKSGFVDIVPKQEKHIVDTNEMVEDDVYKLAEIEYPIFDGDLLGIAYNQKQSRIDFINGYNKAKEILYTEEQMIGFAEWLLNSDSKKVLTRTKESLLQEYLSQSLKQPKQ